ncbi:MAG: hypothetical protein JNL50_07785 [Phycisphaerae bacterium]|nr:hypothetical protein [Phycisphaerae bacterium]
MSKHEAHFLPHEHEHPDSWHRHSADEGAPQGEHAAVASASTLMASFIVLTSSVFLTVGLLIVFFNHFAWQAKAEREETTIMSKEHGEIKGRIDAEQGQYGFVPDKPGLYRIPVTQAMDRVVTKYAPKK